MTTDLIEPKKLFDRFEIKYVIHHTQAAELKKIIAPFVRPDEHNGPNGFYPIVSLYYDTLGYQCFWDKIDGVKVRRKLRIRRYGNAPPDRGVVVEIKHRIDQTLQKRRAGGTFDGVVTALQTGDFAAAGVDSQQSLEEAHLMVRRGEMKPKVFVGYNREAWFGIYERNLRITFDRTLMYSRYHPSRNLESRLTDYFLNPAQFVLELKFNGEIPSWLCAALNSLDLQSRRVSKYCHAINQAYFDGRIL
jgi:SPX domain protein involved in polyphosphate accumulation